MIKNYSDKFFLKGKKVFIIGGCGLIGSKISEVMLSASAEVYVLDNNKREGKKNINLSSTAKNARCVNGSSVMLISFPNRNENKQNKK